MGKIIAFLFCTGMAIAQYTPPPGGTSVLTVGSTAISGGTPNGILYGDGTKLQQSAGVTRTGSGQLTFTQSALGTTYNDAIYLVNTTAAANNAQQVCPNIDLGGQGWGTTASASQAVNWVINCLPVQGAAAPTSILQFGSSVAGGAYSYMMTMTSAGVLSIPSGSQQLRVASVFAPSGFALSFYASTSLVAEVLNTAGYVVVSSLGYNFSSTSSPAGTIDTGMNRLGAGVVTFDTTTIGNSAGSWQATNGTLIGIKSTTGQRFVCATTTGLLVSSATACVGT